MEAMQRPITGAWKQWVLATLMGIAASAAGAQSPGGKVAPPPSDLEPGVNTSAIQPSSSEPAGTRPPEAKPAPAAGKSAAPAKTAAPGAQSTGSPGANSPVARPTPAPKTGAPAGKAHDSIQLDTTQITGNRELPKVLYIVPWKRSDLGDLVGKPVNSLLDEVLTPVDRDVFKRQNRYYDALKPDTAKDAAGAATQGPEVKH